MAKALRFAKSGHGRLQVTLGRPRNSGVWLDGFLRIDLTLHSSVPQLPRLNLQTTAQPMSTEVNENSSGLGSGGNQLSKDLHTNRHLLTHPLTRCGCAGEGIGVQGDDMGVQVRVWR